MTKELDKSKKFMIKSNAIIEARYRLSLQESQVILWLLTQIQPNDNDFRIHKLDTSEFAKFTDTDVQGKYRELRKITKRLMQRVIEIYDSQTKDFLQVSWLSAAKYKSKEGYVLLEFSSFLRPYLLQLKNQFTKIGIIDTLKLKSVYTIRIFELLLQYLSVGHRKITIEELRAYCGVEKQEYADYFDLKRYVIERAKTEITGKTEYEVNYTEIKESRRVVAIEWRIKKKDLVEEKLKGKIKTLEKELNYKAVLVKELMDYGYSKALANKLIKANDEQVIKQALAAVSLQMSRHQVKNPGAMLRTAIEEQWHPERYLPNKISRSRVRTAGSNHDPVTQDFQPLSNLLPKFEK